jgi:hypothetical protein
MIDKSVQTADSPVDKWAAFSLAAVGLGVTLAVMLATVAFVLLVTEPPRSTLTWTTMGFILFVEFLAGTLGVNLLSRQRCRHKLSGAAVVVSYAVLTAYALAGLIAIVVYSFVRDDQNPKDGAFSGVLILLTVLAVCAVVIVYAYDLFFHVQMEPVLAKRQEHSKQGTTIAEAIRALSNTDAPNSELLVRRGKLVKRLEAMETALSHSHGGGIGSEAMETALSHSHGGGIGSIEGWRTHADDPDAERKLRSTAARLDELAHELPSEPEAYAAALSEIEKTTQVLEGAIARLSLQ